MLRDGWKHFMGGVKVCVRCTLLTTIYHSYILKLHPGLLNPPLQLLSPPILLSVTKPPCSVFKRKKNPVKLNCSLFPQVFILPIVPAFLWCALAPAPVPSLQALLMLLDIEEGRLASSPPDRDSKLLCINLSLRPT